MSESTSPDFVPTSKDVLLLESYNAMGGRGLKSALVPNPQNTAEGVMVDKSGKKCDVPNSDWVLLQDLVSSAKEAVKNGGGGSWSRPQAMSCPTGYCFELGPAEKVEEFSRFELTAHMVRRGEPWEITHFQNGQKTVVEKIPAALTKLDDALSDLRKRLFPYTKGEPKYVMSDERKKMVDALDDMTHVTRQEKEMEKMLNERSAHEL